MGGCPDQMKINDILCLGRKVREWILGSGLQIVVQQIGEGKSSYSESHPLEELTAGKRTKILINWVSIHPLVMVSSRLSRALATKNQAPTSSDSNLSEISICGA